MKKGRKTVDPAFNMGYNGTAYSVKRSAQKTSKTVIYLDISVGTDSWIIFCLRKLKNQSEDQPDPGQRYREIESMGIMYTVDFADFDGINIKEHSGRPYTLPGTVATVWGGDTDFVQICFQSRGCRYSNRGSCIMCDYGRGRELTADEVADFCRDSGIFRRKDISEILIGTYGSALDEYEISEECFRIILQRLGDSPIPTIGFETHCDTVTENKLQEIREYLPDKNVYIEMGFESSNDTVREKYLNKKLKLSNLKQAMTYTRRADFITVLNVLLGSPFLSPEEQIQDVVSSVQWAFEQGADNIVLFPMNVKPYTALYRFMEQGLYHPISYWRLAAALYALSEVLSPEQLACVGLSWYGERSDIYPKEYPRMVAPTCCSRCREILFLFYQDFLKTELGEERKAMIEDLMKRTMDCHCREEERGKLKIWKFRGLKMDWE